MSEQDNQRAILDAAYNGDLDTVEHLLAQNPALTAAMVPEVYEPGTTALSLAAYQGHREIARALLAAGADVDALGHDGTPLMMAAYADRRDVAEMLLDSEANVNATASAGETALHFAAYQGFTRMGRLLIERGAQVNCHTTHGPTDMINTSPPVCGETPLHLAAAYGHRDFVELLLNSGADREATDHSGQKALHWAARYRQDTLFPLLR